MYTFKDFPFWGRIVLICAAIFALFFFFSTLFRVEQIPERMPPKVGFVTLGSIHTPGWNQSQYEGIRAACDSLGMPLIYRDNVKEEHEEITKAIQELKNECAEFIYLAGYLYAREAKEEIEKSPEITFATCVYMPDIPNLTSFYVRMCQGRYLAGVLAGLKTRSNSLGYVAAMETPETSREINAFTIGAKSVNPDATVYVYWSDDWADEEKEKDAVRRLVQERNVDVVTYQQDDSVVADTAESMSVDYIGFNTKFENRSEHYLGSVICRWDIYYKNILTKYIKGELGSSNGTWIGMEDGAIWLADVPESIGYDIGYKVVDARKKLEDKYPVFHGPIKDNNGVLRVGEKEVFMDRFLIKDMDWLAEGVVIFEK